VLLLAVAMGMIALIGGSLEYSGLIEDLVSNLRLRRKNFLAFSPALFGMLPMPGGALLSAPLVERGGGNVPAHQKAALNVWFRHVLVLIYPLGTLLVTAKIAGVNLYTAIVYLFPALLFIIALGYIFILKGVEGRNTYTSEFSARKLSIPLIIVLSAPILDIVLVAVFKLMHELLLVVAVSVSLALSFYFGHLSLKDVKPLSLKMKPWNFGLIIIAMFVFLNVFRSSGVPAFIAGLSLSRAVLIVGVGALLGFATGRVQVPFSILAPIYFSKYGVEAMMPSIFALTYLSIFMGYVISPVHPCVLVSLEYFKTDLKSFFKILALPTAAVLLAAFVFACMIS